MEFFPHNIASFEFSKLEHQKWEFQKPFILEVLTTIEDLLVKEKIIYSDLKLQNIIFDPLRRKTALIEMGNSFLIEKSHFIKKMIENSRGNANIYCQPECLELSNKKDEYNESFIDITKLLSYQCGITIAEVTSGISKVFDQKKDCETWDLTERTDLNQFEKNELEGIIRGLINKDPKNRIYID